MKITDLFKKKNKINSKNISYSNYQLNMANTVATSWNGDKFPGSFGFTKLIESCDYWTLRKRSMQLFMENPYAKGIVRRICRNEIFTGLTMNSNPIGDILFPELDEAERMNKAVEFGDYITTQFELYANSFDIFDYKKQLTFGEFQNQVRLESIVCGDGIIVARINPETKLPCWEWINGNYIKSPLESFTLPEGHCIKNGVELDVKGCHVAYYVQTIQGDSVRSERIPVKGERTGRNIAWMVYGSDKMADEVRGEPLLACVLYMLKDLDRYKDAEVRAAVINALVAFTVEKDKGTTIGSRPTDGLRPRYNEVQSGDNKAEPEPHRQPISLMQPGTVFDDLAPGEKVTSYSTNRPNVNYKAFEEAILNGISWALEIPPEIITLKFTSSYSASRQANNEFEVYLKYRTFKNAKDFCQLIFEEFVIQSVITGQLSLPGFITDVIAGKNWRLKAAWLNCSWSGINRPSVDRGKDVKAAHDALNDGLTTFDDECRRINGKSFRQVSNELKREIDMLKSLGFTPGILENNNGEPAYPDENNIDDDVIDDDKEE